MSINGLALGTNNISAQLATKLDIAGGKVLQVVRATDNTTRSTTSTSMVDAGISVTITPQRSTSAILLVWSVTIDNPSAAVGQVEITNASNVAIAGAERGQYFATSTRIIWKSTIVGWATPATTSAITFKGRFATTSGTIVLDNVNATGSLFAIEVSA